MTAAAFCETIVMAASPVIRSLQRVIGMSLPVEPTGVAKGCLLINRENCG